uniref:Uncharacterized protein n=1 Tax=Anguilla anguilla TaxID=7936 RepID=A0A0E9U411_ANGAN
MQQYGMETAFLAMYTFISGPWLPASSAISAGLTHIPAGAIQDSI